jgi:hypothetical protein
MMDLHDRGNAALQTGLNVLHNEYFGSSVCARFSLLTAQPLASLHLVAVSQKRIKTASGFASLFLL